MKPFKLGDRVIVKIDLDMETLQLKLQPGLNLIPMGSEGVVTEVGKNFLQVEIESYPWKLRPEWLLPWQVRAQAEFALYDLVELIRGLTGDDLYQNDNSDERLPAGSRGILYRFLNEKWLDITVFFFDSEYTYSINHSLVRKIEVEQNAILMDRIHRARYHLEDSDHLTALAILNEK